MAGQPVSIGQLRWPCTLALRSEISDPNTGGLVTTFSDEKNIHADIEPVGAAIYLNGQQTENTPFTHRIIIRWRNYDEVSMFHVILRGITLPTGEPRNELFRIHRISEYEGRHRYLMIEAEQEKFDNATQTWLRWQDWHQ